MNLKLQKSAEEVKNKSIFGEIIKEVSYFKMIEWNRELYVAIMKKFLWDKFKKIG